MRKSKEISKADNSTNVGNIVSRKIEVSRDQKKIAVGVPAIFSGGVLGITSIGVSIGASIFGMPVAEALPMIGILTGTLGVTSLFAGLISLDESRHKVLEESCGRAIPLSTARKGRILVSSFHVKEASEIEVKDWIDPKFKTGQANATHTVNQYLAKTKKGYHLEQEVIPNEETIWDLSANALVEVYGVKEAKSIEA